MEEVTNGTEPISHSGSIQVSIGTAVELGLARTPMAVAPTTAYLMLGGRCRMSCAFCAQARESQASALTLSRVTWPEFDREEVVSRLAEAFAEGKIRRACVQVTVTAAAFEETMALLRAVKAACDVPLDIAILPDSLDQVRRLLAAGADQIGFGLDAACQRVFRQVKGGSWTRSLNLIEGTARAFPGRAAVHLIVGLGETEREMVERMQWAQDRGITVGLFAFTPLRGTPLADRPAPPLTAYRRMQAARWLIAHRQASAGEMAFDQAGHLVRLGGQLPRGGEPFETSGCPDCNRPYYNERPGGVLYNYPRRLTAAEAARAVDEMDLAKGG